MQKNKAMQLTQFFRIFMQNIKKQQITFSNSEAQSVDSVLPGLCYYHSSVHVFFAKHL